MPNFELEIWNTNAEAQLLAEYQVIGAHDPAEKTSGAFRRELSGSISQPVDSGGSTTFGWRLLRSISFTMANVILCELPTVLAANDRVDAVRVMIGKVVASVAANVSTECIVEIEQALLGQCEQIAASCVASDGEKQAAENIETSANSIACTFVALAANAFTSLWRYITTGSTPVLHAEATHETRSYDSTSFDGLIFACGDIVARIVVSLCMRDDITLPNNSTGASVPTDVIASIISIILYRIARWIMNQKEERGGWAPWLGSVLRGLIVADERQCHWTGHAFDIIEGKITSRLICPITASLVVDPVVGPHGRIYERERLYLHLQICGCDPVSKKPASALSYTRSPVAARLAKEVARHYGARLEPF